MNIDITEGEKETYVKRCSMSNLNDSAGNAYELLE